MSAELSGGGGGQIARASSVSFLLLRLTPPDYLSLLVKGETNPLECLPLLGLIIAISLPPPLLSHPHPRLHPAVLLFNAF